MATVADLIRHSLRTLGVLAASESPTSSDEADALTTLNDLMDSWAGERLVLYQTLRSTHTLTVGLSPHTIGSGGTFNTTRPVRIDRASITLAGTSNETALDLLTDAEWQAVQSKTSSGTPSSLWVENAHPLMKLHLNPVPNAADTLVLYTWQQIGRFAATSTSVDLPPGYARALRYNLAKELAPEYGVQLSAELADIASESKATLKRQNSRPSLLRCEPSIVGGGFNLTSGDE